MTEKCNYFETYQGKNTFVTVIPAIYLDDLFFVYWRKFLPYLCTLHFKKNKMSYVFNIVQSSYQIEVTLYSLICFDSRPIRARVFNFYKI